jgi:hypothetical protein
MSNPLDTIKEGLKTPKDDVQPSIDLTEVGKKVKQVNGQPYYTPTHIQFFGNNDDNQ